MGQYIVQTTLYWDFVIPFLVEHPPPPLSLYTKPSISREAKGETTAYFMLPILQEDIM